MRYRFLYILLIVAVCVSSCKKKEHVIPRGKMSKIYAEMFVTDQKLTGQPAPIRAQIDTSWVYEPIFEKYGYTSDDYRASVAYYIQDANRFARIVRRSTLIIEGEIKDLRKKKALLEKLEGAEQVSYEPERIFFLTGVGNPDVFGNDTLRFYVDSTGGQLWFDPRDWADTAYYGPVLSLLEERILEGAEEEVSSEEEVEEDLEGSEGSEDEEFSKNGTDSLKVSSNAAFGMEKSSDTTVKRGRQKGKTIDVDNE